MAHGWMAGPKRRTKFEKGEREKKTFDDDNGLIPTAGWVAHNRKRRRRKQTKRYV